MAAACTRASLRPASCRHRLPQYWLRHQGAAQQPGLRRIIVGGRRSDQRRFRSAAPPVFCRPHVTCTNGASRAHRYKDYPRAASMQERTAVAGMDRQDLWAPVFAQGFEQFVIEAVGHLASGFQALASGNGLAGRCRLCESHRRVSARVCRYRPPDGSLYSAGIRRHTVHWICAMAIRARLVPCKTPPHRRDAGCTRAPPCVFRQSGGNSPAKKTNALRAAPQCPRSFGIGSVATSTVPFFISKFHFQNS